MNNLEVTLKLVDDLIKDNGLQWPDSMQFTKKRITRWWVDLVWIDLTHASGKLTISLDVAGTMRVIGDISRAPKYEPGIINKPQ